MADQERYSVRLEPDLARKIELARELTGLTPQQILTRWIEQGAIPRLLEPAPPMVDLLVIAMDALVQAARLARRQQERRS